MGDNIISTNKLSITLGKKKILKDITFEVKEKEIFGFLGPSGAGKTTTIKLLTKQFIPTSGECMVQVPRESIGILSDNSGAYERLTVYRNLSFFAELSKVSNKKVEEILKKVKLWEDKDKKVKDLSKGNRQKIQFIVSNLHEPEFLILDEPFSGLDPISVEELKRCICELKKEGKTIIFSSHRMDHVEELCDDLIILNHGKTVLKGNLNEIKENYEIDGKRNNNLNDIFIDSVGKEEIKEEQNEH